MHIFNIRPVGSLIILQGENKFLLEGALQIIIALTIRLCKPLYL